MHSGLEAGSLGRSVLHLNQQLAQLTRQGIRFISTTQGLDTDRSNPTSRLLLQILASVAEFERQMTRERTLVGIRAARAENESAGPDGSSGATRWSG